MTTIIKGRLVADPELRFTPSGAAVTNLTIAENQRRKVGDEWQDGPTTFWRCSIWREAAENVAESLTKGCAVVAVGKVEQRDYETNEGEKRTVFEVQLDAIGPDLRWQTARVARAERKTGGFAQQPAADPWAGPQGGGDEAPF